MGWSDRWIVGGMFVLLAACSPVTNQISLPDLHVKKQVVTEQATSVQMTRAPLQRVTSNVHDKPVTAPLDSVESRLTKLTASAQSIAVTPQATVKQLPILMYHSISDNPKNLLCLSPAKFKEQMLFLHETGYQPITAGELAEWGSGKVLTGKPVLITLDDGYRDNYTEAYPILKESGMKATIYLISAFLGGSNNLTQDMAKEMLASGRVEFGAHTVTHADLSTLTGTRLHDEIYSSKQQLETQLGVPITAFCYPSGRFNQQAVQTVKEAGYLTAVTTKPGQAEVSQGMYTLHRQRINGDITLEQFKRLLPQAP